MHVLPIILSGGSGTRLWPFSRASRPKQFLSFGSGFSLFQETVRRCRSEVFDPRPIIVGAGAHRFMIAEALQEIGIEADVLLEPAPRNSCAAIAAGCFEALRRSRDATVLVLAADHHIPDAAGFSASVAEGLADAEAGRLITFGVRPDRPTSAYGYILPGKLLLRASKVVHFLEKPPLEMAERFVREGYLWNSGNFLFRAEAYLQELERLQPDVFAAVHQAWAGAEPDLQFSRLEAQSFLRAPSISVDYGVMERTTKAAVLPVDYAWSDVGSWDAVSGLLSKDQAGNTIIGDATIIDGLDNFVHSEDKLTALVGVQGLVVVSTRDSVLVTSKPEAEKVKLLVELLRRDDRREATQGPQTFQPWGIYEELHCGGGYQVKRLLVKPGGVLPLQKHTRSAEHWIIVQGKMEMAVDSTVAKLEAGQSVYIPVGSAHRAANRYSEPVVVINVQIGSCLSEGDIICLEA